MKKRRFSGGSELESIGYECKVYRVIGVYRV